MRTGNLNLHVENGIEATVVLDPEAMSSLAKALADRSMGLGLNEPICITLSCNPLVTLSFDLGATVLRPSDLGVHNPGKGAVSPAPATQDDLDIQAGRAVDVGAFYLHGSYHIPRDVWPSIEGKRLLDRRGRSEIVAVYRSKDSGMVRGFMANDRPHERSDWELVWDNRSPT